VPSSIFVFNISMFAICCLVTSSSVIFAPVSSSIKAFVSFITCSWCLKGTSKFSPANRTNLS